MSDASRRPDWDDYFMRIAEAVSARGDCLRAKHGAVVVNQARRIVATGYNGTPPGAPSCLAGACPRGALSPEEVPHNHADYSNCISLHAEQNAIAHSDRRDTEGGTIYVTGVPCDMCFKLIAAAGILRVVTPDLVGRLGYLVRSGGATQARLTTLERST